MTRKSITIVPTRSPDGVAFGKAAHDIAVDCGYAVRVLSAPEKMDVWKATWGKGAIVFDATIEASGQHNYATADYSLLFSPYSVVVSRTYLPANFRGHLEPIAPPYPDRWSNKDLLEPLKRRLAELAPRLPRPAGGRTLDGVNKEFDVAQSVVQEKRRDSFDVFLSYRGTHSQAAETLVADAQRQHGQRVRIIRTDDLSYPDEILTLQRRWQVLRWIYASLSAAHELWVLWSHDYFDSWWTQGEIVSFANMSSDKRPALRVHNAGPGAVPAHESIVPRLKRHQERTILKRFLLCNMPESLPRIRTLASRRLPRILLGVPDDPMLAPSFSHDPMLECVSCKRNMPSGHALDVDAFLDGGLSSLRAISSGSLERARADGELCCPSCGALYRIGSGPSRYWWYPVRGQGPTGPGGVVLEESPLCRALLQA